jgi:hypothetical protein
MSTATPGGDAQVVALAGSAPVLFAYEAGSALADNTSAPARRVFAFPSNQSPRNLTEDGRALVLAALTWALDDDTPPVNRAPMPNAGADQTLRTPADSTTLTGSATDDGRPTDAVDFFWTQISGPNDATIATRDAATTEVSGLTVGTYIFELSADDGELTGTDRVSVNVLPSTSRVAFIAGPDQRSSPDQLLIDRFVAAGAQIVDVADTDAETANYDNVDLVFISATVRAPLFGDFFADFALPVMTTEHLLLDDFGMAQSPRSRWPRTIDIVDPTHPLAAGFDGTITITSQRTALGTALPGPGATIVGEVVGRPALFAYDAGDPMVGDTPAPAYRLFITGTAQTSLRATSAYIALFDAAVAEALAAAGGGNGGGDGGGGDDGGDDPEPLVANPDTGTTSEDLPLTTDSDGGVLANDTGEAPLTVTDFDDVSELGAAVTVAADGSFTYDPTGSSILQDLDADQSRDDTFTYTVTAANGETATATVTITVTGLAEPVEGPSIDNPMFGEGWQAEPQEVIFTADGQTATVELVHYGPDGAPSGRTVPAGVAVDRTTTLFDVAEAVDGSIDVGGSETVGTELLVVTVPGEGVEPDTTIRVWVTSLSSRICPGW